MKSILLGILGSALVNNAVFGQLLAVRASIDAAGQRSQIGRTSLATAMALIVSVAGTWAIERWLLAPAGLLELSLIAQVMCIVFSSTLFARICRDAASDIGSADFSLAVIANVAMLGSVLLNSPRPADPALLLARTVGASLGFGLALALLDALGDRLRSCQVPDSFRGAPIAVLSAGLIALAFLGLIGLDRD